MRGRLFASDHLQTGLYCPLPFWTVREWPIELKDLQCDLRAPDDPVPIDASSLDYDRVLETPVPLDVSRTVLNSTQRDCVDQFLARLMQRFFLDRCLSTTDGNLPVFHSDALAKRWQSLRQALSASSSATTQHLPPNSGSRQLSCCGQARSLRCWVARSPPV